MAKSCWGCDNDMGIDEEAYDDYCERRDANREPDPPPTNSQYQSWGNTGTHA